MMLSKSGIFNLGFLGFENDLFDKLLNQTTLPKLILKKIEKGYLLEMDIPGINKEDVEIKIEKRILSISGERKEEKENYLIKEISFGSFKRRFKLPENIDENKIDANFENGVLKISLEEKENKEELIKKIEIK